MKTLHKIIPNWSDEDVPYCSYLCPSNEGKRCKVLGYNYSSICEPAVIMWMERKQPAEQGMKSADGGITKDNERRCGSCLGEGKVR